MKISEKCAELFTALNALHSEIKNPGTPANNSYFKSKYTPLDYMLDHAKPLIEKHGLAVLQFPCSNETGVGVVTIVTHESGQFIESEPYYLPLAKKDPQAGGSAITYARRYSLAAALGIASDPDDDGNEASKKPTTYPCSICGKQVKKDIAEKSVEVNGAVFCSGTCKKTKEEQDLDSYAHGLAHEDAGDRL